jgi:4-alpha-glucanotransferase
MYLSVSALPSPYGVGGFGAEARQFIDLIADTGLKYWQILPLSYAGTHFMPYSGQSSFAKHPLYVDPFNLFELGLLSAEEIIIPAAIPTVRTSYETMLWKYRLITLAFERFKTGDATLRREMRMYVAEEAAWLPDFALFVSLSRFYHHQPWQVWPIELRNRHEKDLQIWEINLQDHINEALFTQFILDRQWQSIRAYAHEKKVELIGDIPIYVAPDSADTWQHRGYFNVGRLGMPQEYSGMPPDYFSVRGQNWGSPTYNWEKIAEENFDWTIRRFRASLKDTDMLRIDHFLGYTHYWGIPSGRANKDGVWHDAPGQKLFDAVKAVIPASHFIVEDLGVENPNTDSVRDSFGAPGMRVLEERMQDLPKNPAISFERPIVAYTSTHDSNTLLGKFALLKDDEKMAVKDWLNLHTSTELPLHLQLVAALLKSNAEIVMIPLADMMGWDNRARFNKPATVSPQNWSWRFQWEDVELVNLSVLKKLLS